MKKQVKKILVLALVVALVFSLGATALATEFTDMPASNYWSYNALNAAVTNHLLNGYSGKLSPEADLTRAEMAAIINRAFGATQEADISSYTDVKTTAWYYCDVAKAVQMCTFKGDGACIMRPECAITRQEAFLVLARALKLTDGNTTVLDQFSDKALVADWAKSALSAMISAGFVNGSDGKLNPTGAISRQEFAQVVYNTIKNYISSAGTVTSVADGDVMVNVAGVTLKNLTVKGDLIVGDGVANGDITLDNVTVEGRLIVRGGGQNSIKIINHSSVGNIVVSKTSDGKVRIVSDATSDIEVIYVDDGKDGIIIEGTVTTLTIAASIDVEVKGAIENVVVTEEATGATINVASGATIGNLISNANNVIVSGEGEITTATVNGNNTAFNVVGTVLTVGSGVTGTTANGEAVEGGTEVVVEEPESGDSGSGGGTSTSTVSVSSVTLYLSDNTSVTKSATDGYTFALSAYSDETAITGIEITTSSTTTYNVSDYSIDTNEEVPISKFLDMIGLDNNATVSLGKIRALGNSFSVSGTVTGGSSLTVTFNVRNSGGYYNLTNDGTTVTAQLINDADINTASGTISGLSIDPVKVLVANIKDDTNTTVDYSVSYTKNNLTVTRKYTGYSSIENFTLSDLIQLVNNNGGRTIDKLSELTGATVTITYGTRTLTLEFIA